MDEPKRKIYEFGGFRFDVLRLSLEGIDGTGIALKPKACEILLALIERRDKAVSKEELMSIVWPDSYVEEGNLTVNLSMLRKALGDNAGRQQFIVTVPGRGYRFVADVRESTEDSSQHGDAPKSRRVLLYLGAAALLLAGLAIYGFYTFRTPAAPSFENFRLTKLTTSGKVSTAAISSDGRFVAYVINESGGQSIWLKQLSTGSDVQIVPREMDVHYPGLVFSNDGEHLFLLKSGKDQPNALYRTAVLGGTFEKLAEDVDSLPAISRDGKTLAFVRGMPDQNETVLFTLNAGGGEPQRLVSRPSAEGFNLNTRPAWSPDGTKIVTAVRKQDESGKYSVLAAVDPQGGKIEELLSPRFVQVAQLAWAPDTDALIVAGETEDSPSRNQIVNISYPGGGARRITNDLDDYRALSLTADGKTLLTINTDLQTNIWVVPRLDTSNSIQVTSTNYDGSDGVAWMPDGSLVYTSRGGGRVDLWKLEPAGDAKRQITSNAGDNFQPAVSSDGKYIAFVSNRSGKQNIWMADADGGNPHRITEGIDDGSPDFSPDGKTVVYRSYVKGNPAIFSLDIASGASKQLTNKISGRPQFSPDGSEILCTYRPEATGPQRVSIIPASGGEPARVFNFTSSLFRWTNDSRGILFVDQSADGGMNLWIYDFYGFASARTWHITPWTTDRIYWFDISPDGKNLACARGTSQSDVVLITSEPAAK